MGENVMSADNESHNRIDAPGDEAERRKRPGGPDGPPLKLDELGELAWHVGRLLHRVEALERSRGSKDPDEFLSVFAGLQVRLGQHECAKQDGEPYDSDVLLLMRGLLKLRRKPL